MALPDPKHLIPGQHQIYSDPGVLFLSLDLDLDLRLGTNFLGLRSETKLANEFQLFRTPQPDPLTSLSSGPGLVFVSSRDTFPHVGVP
jgi:hypothetical protein